ncbi:MAG: hypothetical protein K2M43_00910 [Mycoplasmoidaceae bacterium]|nr:hypothetical protein [Mycoplasmoidaceae bacterium]
MNNDFTYYAYLAYQNLKKIFIAHASVVGDLYTSYVPGTFKMSVDLKYNPISQIFDYLKVHITGSAGLILGITIPIDFNFM